MRSELKECWSILCQIHVLTKHYTLLAEEYSLTMKAFLQPMKEQKDAYEHVIRAYSKYLQDNCDDSDSYIVKSMEKAIGHEYRAFF